MGHSEDHRKKENVWLGTLGALLFSLIGAGTYFVLNAMGLIESLSGFVAVFCAINGYAVFAKKESKKGVIISVIIAAAVIIVSWYLCFCLSTIEAINQAASELPESFRYTIGFAEFVPKSFIVIKDQPKVLISLGLSFVFGAIGYFSHAYGLFYTKKSKRHSGK